MPKSEVQNPKAPNPKAIKKLLRTFGLWTNNAPKRTPKAIAGKINIGLFSIERLTTSSKYPGPMVPPNATTPCIAANTKKKNQVILALKIYVNAFAISAILSPIVMPSGFLGKSLGRENGIIIAAIKKISQIINVAVWPNKKSDTEPKKRPASCPPAKVKTKTELATASWDLLTIWALAAEIAGKKKVLPAKYRNERKMDKKTLSKVKSITTTAMAIIELAQIISFLRSTKSAARPAAAINIRLEIVSESIIPETLKLLPVFKKTEEIKDIIKKPEAICPQSKVRFKRKKLRQLAISMITFDKESIITTSGRRDKSARFCHLSFRGRWM